jgi:hypothetical protein
VPPTEVDVLPGKAIAARALEAAGTASSVHVEIRARQGKRRMTMSQDSTPTSGHQVFQREGIRAEAVVVNGAAYITGNRSGFAQFFGFPAKAADVLAGEWVSYTPQDAGFETIAKDVTMKSFLRSLKFKGSKGKTREDTIAGQRVVAVRGSYDGYKAVLYVRLDSLGLPVRLEGTKRNGQTMRMDFSRWNAPLQIATPTAFSIASLRGESEA